MGRRRKREWYVIEIEEPQAKAEAWIRELASKNLWGLLFWIPQISVKRLIDGKWQDASEPLLPDYLLVSSRKGPDYIEEVLGVRLLRFGKYPYPLTMEEVRRIEICENLETFSAGYIFKPGQKVEVREDARSSYAGMKAAFMCLLVGKNGFYARVHLLVQEIRTVVNLPYDHLVPCIKESSEGKKEPREKSLFLQGGRWIGLSRRKKTTTKNGVQSGKT